MNSGRARFVTLLAIPLVLIGPLDAAQAVLICGSDVLVSYIAFGAEGCNFGYANFSNFVYPVKRRPGKSLGPLISMYFHTQRSATGASRSVQGSNSRTTLE
jgi:hypothetical protein